jgi:hypothetical protein
VGGDVQVSKAIKLFTLKASPHNLYYMVTDEYLVQKVLNDL